MTKPKYSEKLLDPRWQKKRLEIFQRDEFVCQYCYSKIKTLCIHHKQYMVDKDPWDYPDDYLITLCFQCHQEETELRKKYESILLETLRLNNFKWHEIKILAEAAMSKDLPTMDSLITSYRELCDTKSDSEIISIFEQRMERLENLS